jgi:hypothetical protein
VLAWVFRMKLKLDCLCLGRWIVGLGDLVSGVLVHMVV